MGLSTKILNLIPIDPQTGSISVPIYQTATFVQESPGVHKGFDYSRSNNPTRAILESTIAAIEGGHTGLAFASGLAAIDTIVKTLQAGDEIIAIDDIYGGAFRLFFHIYQKFGIEVKYVDTTDPRNIETAIGPNTKLIWIESPSNPTLKVSDIRQIASIARKNDILLCVDNTFASPALQKPLDLGADLVVHSATKYLAGHSDLIAGLIVAKDPELGGKLKFIQNAGGNILGPFDSWLVLRGIETLSLRVERQSQTALAIAYFLESHPKVKKVFYPGLPSHPQHAIASKQQSKYGGIVSFVLEEDAENATANFLKNCKLFHLAESLGGVKSICCLPAAMTHKSVPQEQRLAAGITDGFIRLSVGLEEEEDLIADLRHALQAVEAASPAQLSSTF